MPVKFKDEFKLQNFGLGHDKPHDFHKSAWKWPHGVFVAWKVFWALWHLAWLARSIDDQVDMDAGEKWFIYLTNWSYFILTVQSILHLIVVLKSTCRTRNGELQELPTTTNWLEKTLWVFTSVSFDATIVVAIVYWGFIFKDLTKALSIMTHAVTTLYAVSDTFVSSSPTRLLHFIYGALYGLFYGLFTLFYHLGDGTNNNGDPYVYEILAWTNPGKSLGLVLGLMFLVTPVVHLVVFGLHSLRVYLSERCACGRQSEKRENYDLA